LVVAVTNDANSARRRRANAIGLVAVSVLVLLAFAEIAFAGKTFSTYAGPGVEGFTPIEITGEAGLDDLRMDQGASSWQSESWAEVNDRVLEQGDLPLWNPYQGIGAPQAANMQSGVLDPLLLPANLNSSLWVRDVMMLATFVAGAMAMFALARVIGLGGFESVVAAGAFALTGWLMLYSNNTFTRAYAFLPLLFLLIELVVRQFRRWHVLALGLATGGAITIGMPEATFAVLLLSGAYAVVRSIQTRSENSWWGLVRLSAGFALGLALAAPLLAIFLEYLPQSFNTHSGGSTTGLGVDPPRMILNLIVPFHAGQPFNALGTWSGTRGWLAAGTAMLAIVGLSGRTLTRRLNGFVFAGFALVIMLRVYDFGVLDWTGRLPIFERVNWPAYLLPALPFFVAIVAGIGLSVLRARDLDVRRFGILAGVAVIGVWLLAINNGNRAVTITGDHALRHFGLAALIAAGIAIAAIAATRWRFAVIVAGLLVLVELMLLAPRGIYHDRIDPYPDTPSVVALAELTSTDPLARIYAFDGELFPNAATAYGFYDIRMVDALYVNRYFRYVKEFIQPTADSRFVGGPWSSPEVQLTRYAANPMLDMLGVRYLVADAQVPNTTLMLDVAEETSADVRAIDIPQDPRASIFSHAPGTIMLPDPPADATALALAIGMDKEAFVDEINDGVDFTVKGIDAGGREVVLFSESYIPRLDPVTPEWRDRTVGLMHEGERIMSLSLITEPRTNTSTDWSGWTSLAYLENPGEKAAEALTLEVVTENSVVYANPTALPRAWVASTVYGVSDLEEAIAFFADRRDPDGAVQFTPEEEVVVEGGESAAPPPGCDGPTDVTISEYDSDFVDLIATTPCPGFLVLADAWYPGWRVEVNGESETIYPTNVALRGVPVPAGTSSVRFSYEPGSFRLGLLTAFMGLGVFAAWVAVSRWRERKTPALVPGPDQTEPETPRPDWRAPPA
jgi:hypothetical protein